MEIEKAVHDVAQLLRDTSLISGFLLGMWFAEWRVHRWYKGIVDDLTKRISKSLIKSNDEKKIEKLIQRFEKEDIDDKPHN